MYKKMKKRSRKGIPNSIRGYAWKMLINGDQYLISDREEYFKYLLSLKDGNHELTQSIFRDVTRTFTEHVYFKDKFGQGQKALFSVLKAMAMHDREVGYMQGMGYIVAVLLM